MKRVIALVLTCCLLLSACGQVTDSVATSDRGTTSVPGSVSTAEAVSNEETFPPASTSTVARDNIPASDGPAPSENTSEIPVKFQPVVPEFHNLSDPTLLSYVESSVYQELIDNLDDGYFVQNLSTVYVSQEYLEELSYNSQENIFFGYTLAELDEQFQGTRYIFTLDDEGKTTVEPFEEYDRAYESAIKNVAIGTGVILICVTISVVSGGVGAPAINMIFAASAKTGTIMALSSGGIGAVASGVITGVQTQDFDEAVKAAALAGSEGFKWGAISGTISGGFSEAMWLKTAVKGGLTINEAAIIQRESKYSLNTIKSFSNMEQYNICKQAGLKEVTLNGHSVLVRGDIDLNFLDELGRTNLERMVQGMAPLDATGTSYQLHHIGQKTDSPLAMLTRAEHIQNGNDPIWHTFNNPTQVHMPGNTWDTQRQKIWTAFAASLS